MNAITKESVKNLADKRMPLFYDYLAIPTVSTEHRAIPETVTYVENLLQELGGETQILDDLGGHPVVYGYFKASPKGNANKTLLFYNHYDVQPPEPLDEWQTDPFTATEKEGILYARGTADNKGNFIVRLNAIAALLETEDGLPCNIKFLVEGEEEIGSRNLEKYLQKYADLFKADACIWEFGGKDNEERFVIDAGIKGMAYLELTADSAGIDIHSSMGAIVDNAAWRLTHALASMRDVNNNILVDGFYDDITPPTKEEKELVASLPFNLASTVAQYGLTRPLITDGKEITPNEALVFYPTMTICGILSGFVGEGTKTVLPRTAKAKVDCRLVPGQTPAHIADCVQKHLDKHGFEDVKVHLLDGQKAFRSNMTDPFVQQVVKSAEKAYGGDTDILLVPNSAGTGPMYIFDQYLNLPILCSGVGWSQSKAHAPNESIRMADFYEGIMHMIYLMEDFAE